MAHFSIDHASKMAGQPNWSTVLLKKYHDLWMRRKKLRSSPTWLHWIYRLDLMIGLMMSLKIDISIEKKKQRNLRSLEKQLLKRGWLPISIVVVWPVIVHFLNAMTAAWLANINKGQLMTRKYYCMYMCVFAPVSYFFKSTQFPNEEQTTAQGKQKQIKTT